MEGIKVEKKGGMQEDFMQGKITGGLVKSGATQEQADGIATQIEAWAPTAAQNGIIKSSDIRTKVMELLQAVNPEAHNAFMAYQKV